MSCLLIYLIHILQPTANMVLFDAKGSIKKYNTAEEILADFYPIRLRMYQKRRRHLLKVGSYPIQTKISATHLLQCGSMTARVPFSL